MSEPKATLFVFAGNNGSGKSTIRNLLTDSIGVSVNIDADAIARRIDPTQPEKVRVSAGKEAIRLAKECIQETSGFFNGDHAVWRLCDTAYSGSKSQRV